MYLLQKRGKLFSGQVFLIYCVVYGIGRFTTESYRGDGERGFVFDGLMSHSQWIALLVLAASALLYVYLRKRGLKQSV
jgi:phosphatidylglycerol:prolipoprotein diacylglycerol transferase